MMRRLRIWRRRRARRNVWQDWAIRHYWQCYLSSEREMAYWEKIYALWSK